MNGSSDNNHILGILDDFSIIVKVPDRLRSWRLSVHSWVVRSLQPYISQFFNNQVSTLSILESIQPLLDSQLCYFENVNYLHNRTAEIVQASWVD